MKNNHIIIMMPLNFNPEADYQLENERVILRPLASNDLENLLPFALNEPEIWKYSPVSAKGIDGMRAYIESALKGRADGKQYSFIVFDKVSNSYAGSTRFYDIIPEYQSLQLGYTWYGEKFRGTGLNKNCKYLLLQFAFEEIGAERVEFRADARNEQSIAAMKSIGCIVEGVLRSQMPVSLGGRRDSIILSILKEEWFGSVKQNLQSRLV